MAEWERHINERRTLGRLHTCAIAARDAKRELDRAVIATRHAEHS